LFTAEKYPIEWATFVESCLSSEKNRWARKYFSHVDSKPRLKFGRDCALAQKHLADEDFEEAAELYRQIINRCGPEDDKAFYQFQLCTSMFHAAPPADVVPQLDSFIHNYRTSHPELTREAIMMKARLHLQSRRLDDALAHFHAVAADCAGTPQAREATFFAAYCTMLQGELDSASQALNAVVQDHPRSQWARRARLCLAWIRDMAANQTAAN
jgi:outer membrane protein assembly factor BamD (BamD/ComL family)